jgi:hypothetical protein
MKITRNLLTFLAVTGFVVSPTAAIADAPHKSTSSPIWTYGVPVNGSTSLVRTRNGLTAQFKTTGLPAGHAVTLWIMFFDNPDACTVPGACVLAPAPVGDIGGSGVKFDFHYAGGHIVNDAQTTLTGYLQTGELSTSGFAELEAVDLIAALTNPMGAQVILALHSHGPAQSGQTLVEQMNSYLGGCVLPFLGPGGFAGGPGDIPALAGECSTIQLAFHNPPE